jgi:hypothetical protein
LLSVKTVFKQRRKSEREVESAIDALECVVGKYADTGRDLKEQQSVLKEQQSALRALQKAMMEQTEKICALEAERLKLEDEKEEAELAYQMAMERLVKENKCHSEMLVLAPSSGSDSTEAIATQRTGNGTTHTSRDTGGWSDCPSNDSTEQTASGPLGITKQPREKRGHQQTDEDNAKKRKTFHDEIRNVGRLSPDAAVHSVGQDNALATTTISACQQTGKQKVHANESCPGFASTVNHATSPGPSHCQENEPLDDREYIL